MNRNKISKKKAAVSVMAGLLAVGGIMGASAFFTDQAHTDAKAHMGGLNMTVEDLTDLDGDYSKWTVVKDEAGNETGIEEQDSVIDTAVAAGVAANAKGDRLSGNATGRAVTQIEKTAATDVDHPSVNIINPGDSGLLQFKVANVDAKSFRTAMKTSVIVKLTDDAKEADGETIATLAAAHKAGTDSGNALSVQYPDGTVVNNEALKYTINDYAAYTIEGMGAPIVEFGHSEDGKTFEAAGDDKTANAMRLTYYTELDTLKGSQENTEDTDGKNSEMVYAFETKFDRLAQNKFQGAQIDIKSDFYALQNRKTAGTWTSVTEAADAVDNSIKPATGDWTQIGSFEKVVNIKDGVQNDFGEEANQKDSGSITDAIVGSPNQDGTNN